MLYDSQKNSRLEGSKNFLPNADIAIFDRFLRHIKLRQMFAALPDSRQQSKICYSHVSLLMWAFSACVFRTASKNALNTEFKGKERTCLQSFANFLGIRENRLPDSTVVDDFLKTLDPSDFNELGCFCTTPRKGIFQALD